jgi:transposase
VVAFSETMSFPNYKKVHSRFQHWCRKEVFRNVLTSLANTLRDQGEIDERESFIDATFASAKGGGADIGKTKRGKGVKIMGIVDRNGLLLAVCTHAANHHEVTLVQLTFDFYMIEAKPEKLIGDKAYDSDDLDNNLGKQGIDMIAPHKSNRVIEPTQDGRKLRRYKRRWIVERFFAWLQWHRRLLVGWEYYAENFLGLVKLASISILLKRF